MVRPPTSRSVVPGPGRLGLVEETAPSDLRTLGWTGEESLELLWSLSRAPNADLALRTLVRMYELLGAGWAEFDSALRTDKGFRGRILGLVGASSALADHLVADDSTWRLLLTKEGQSSGVSAKIELPTKATLVAELLEAVGAEPETGPNAAPDLYRATVTGPPAVIALRKKYRDQIMVLAAYDLAATVENEPVLPYTVVGSQLSDMADAALTAALAVAVATVSPDSPCPTRLAVVAMGKCGARELNYVSDVDVVFVAEPADSQASRIAGEMMRIGSSAFFEVDAALRPEGKRGELVRTLDSHVAYYKRWAKTWEFQALLKARPMTGDIALGNDYVDAVNPMVWLASQREDFVPEVRAMRRRVEEMVPPELREREIKLGRGSLRDVEFAVQLLQLVHGRTDESLRVLGTTDALTALTEGGYVGRDDAANLTASYEFLRLIEHRLQMQRMRRTHTLPPQDDEEALRWLARSAHMRPDGNRDALGVLNAEIKRNAQRIRRLHAKLFYRPLLDSVVKFDSETVRLTPDAATRQLAALGYATPQNALGHLRALVGSGTRRGQIQAVLLPTLLEWLADTPDPDAGLLNYRRLSESAGEQTWFLRVLRDEGAVAQRLMIVLGSSAYVPDLLIKAPEVIRLFADGPTGPRLLDVEPEETYRAILSSSARYEDPVRAINAARALRRHELARVASADILGMLDVPQVCRALSSVWAAVINAALAAAVRASEKERGEPAPATLAVIGMGRLGGGELGYGSDADVLFVCDPVDGADETVAVKWANTIADRIRKLLGAPSTDPPLEVDTGLRPEGRSGPVVRTLSSYAAYYSQWAQAWEVQALLRAHQVAGDQDLGIRFLLMADKVRYPEGGVSADAVREIRRIKARIDSERLPKGADPSTHTKLGRGGLADIEWTVQLIQLRYAHKVLTLHNTSTLQSLDAIGAAELMSETDVELLREAWILATKARNALVLVRGKPTDQLPRPGAVLSAVAQVAGWENGDAGAFLDNYLRVTRRAKAVVERTFGGN
ncbi:MULTISPECIES: bifunctional [glutamine synthetase] adenylyltransferase/[glutamine synthetase]-adenylyl-L-tyrosine phosphorylase [unclassified Rhodococcus (in: high G+C Gram-positive bacteria)]|uniref:bifunctional [glutamine synthetase] adenylyltransferase/[glutamine synthetase]-adenylyl-L-tyrosine phosphorylase n=1 Tax=unclassified Rhodococcus (in: high G+C Gram-positive bacteria) TaxID=192944 RepID=UPI0011EC073A|nr:MULTISPECIES: bifunctional [glutamine synthetase] adenylyltransferase/[glutamine synthetase]-adenylyl-L-tyrosine phosphorylase [unclassified Rhodococcus (in: high G+C Gram-positive bacteria)]KAA0925793.1 bifunctional [glutamine synthetase] adenylyltransferase/[glutamine synthetase]-adenylyl-L-tyrosine phosphorylase [Rhodococcus sp. ANT_H53B]MDI9926407.1 bifunctional [glutamine synthetase] adenylyltransferase/[glutamine synthetase]-adenylyl-L-tyrosine phosphorylase [Rhodococcus sp. IEGM 1341]